MVVCYSYFMSAPNCEPAKPAGKFFDNQRNVVRLPDNDERLLQKTRGPAFHPTHINPYQVAISVNIACIFVMLYLNMQKSKVYFVFPSRISWYFPKQFTVRGSQFFLKMCPPFVSLLVSALFRWPCSISIHLSPRSVTAGVRPFPL